MALGDPVLNEVALLGDLPAGTHSITGLEGLTFEGAAHRNISVLLEDKGLKIWGGGIAAYPGCIELYGQTEGVDPGAMQVLTPNTALNALLSRIKIAGAADVVDITFANALLKGMKLGEALDANSFAITNLAATNFGDDIALGFGAGPEAKLVWDTTDIDAMLLKIDVPAAAAGDVPVMALGIAIAGVDLTFFDGLTEPVAAVVDIAKTSWATFGFGAAAAPQLNCGGVATEIGCASRFVAEKQLSLDTVTDLTIAVGVITVTKSFHKVDTEALAAADDLDRIEGGAEGDILVLEAKDSGRTVVCKHGTNNLWLEGSADFSLDNAIDTIMLICLGGNWHELSRSNNAV